jgi:hypothetical protein
VEIGGGGGSGIGGGHNTTHNTSSDGGIFHGVKGEEEGKCKEDGGEGVAAMDVSATAAAVADREKDFDEADVGTRAPRRFWEEAEPRAALAALEAEFAAAVRAANGGGGGGGTKPAADAGAWRTHFRYIFARECERHTRSGDDYHSNSAFTCDDVRVSRCSRPPSLPGAPHNPDDRHVPTFDGPSRRSYDGPSRAPSDPRDTNDRTLARVFPLFFRAGEKPVMYTVGPKGQGFGGSGLGGSRVRM